MEPLAYLYAAIAYETAIDVPVDWHQRRQLLQPLKRDAKKPTKVLANPGQLFPDIAIAF